MNLFFNFIILERKTYLIKANNHAKIRKTPCVFCYLLIIFKSLTNTNSSQTSDYKPAAG